MTDSLFSSSGFTFGFILVSLVAVLGLLLLIAASFKYSITIKQKTLSLHTQTIIGLALQLPCMAYLLMGLML